MLGKVSEMVEILHRRERKDLDSVGREIFCLRRRSVATADVGSCSSSISLFCPLEEEHDVDGGRGAANILGGFFLSDLCC